MEQDLNKVESDTVKYTIGVVIGLILSVVSLFLSTGDASVLLPEQNAINFTSFLLALFGSNVVSNLNQKRSSQTTDTNTEYINQKADINVSETANADSGYSFLSNIKQMIKPLIRSLEESLVFVPVTIADTAQKVYTGNLNNDEFVGKAGQWFLKNFNKQYKDAIKQQEIGTEVKDNIIDIIKEYSELESIIFLSELCNKKVKDITDSDKEKLEKMKETKWESYTSDGYSFNHLEVIAENLSKVIDENVDEDFDEDDTIGDLVIEKIIKEKYPRFMEKYENINDMFKDYGYPVETVNLLQEIEENRKITESIEKDLREAEEDLEKAKKELEKVQSEEKFEEVKRLGKKVKKLKNDLKKEGLSTYKDEQLQAYGERLKSEIDDEEVFENYSKLKESAEYLLKVIIREQNRRKQKEIEKGLNKVESNTIKYTIGAAAGLILTGLSVFFSLGNLSVLLTENNLITITVALFVSNIMNNLKWKLQYLNSQLTDTEGNKQEIDIDNSDKYQVTDDETANIDTEYSLFGSIKQIIIPFFLSLTQSGFFVSVAIVDTAQKIYTGNLNNDEYVGTLGQIFLNSMPPYRNAIEHQKNIDEQTDDMNKRIKEYKSAKFLQKLFYIENDENRTKTVGEITDYDKEEWKKLKTEEKTKDFLFYDKEYSEDILYALDYVFNNEGTIASNKSIVELVCEKMEENRKNIKDKENDKNGVRYTQFFKSIDSFFKDGKIYAQEGIKSFIKTKMDSDVQINKDEGLKLLEELEEKVLSYENEEELQNYRDKLEYGIKEELFENEEEECAVNLIVSIIEEQREKGKQLQKEMEQDLNKVENRTIVYSTILTVGLLRTGITMFLISGDASVLLTGVSLAKIFVALIGSNIVNDLKWKRKFSNSQLLGIKSTKKETDIKKTISVKYQNLKLSKPLHLSILSPYINKVYNKTKDKQGFVWSMLNKVLSNYDVLIAPLWEEGVFGLGALGISFGLSFVFAGTVIPLIGFFIWRVIVFSIAHIPSDISEYEKGETEKSKNRFIAEKLIKRLAGSVLLSIPYLAIMPMSAVMPFVAPIGGYAVGIALHSLLNFIAQTDFGKKLKLPLFSLNKFDSEEIESKLYEKEEELKKENIDESTLKEIENNLRKLLKDLDDNKIKEKELETKANKLLLIDLIKQLKKNYNEEHSCYDNIKQDMEIIKKTINEIKIEYDEDFIFQFFIESLYHNEDYEISLPNILNKDNNGAIGYFAEKVFIYYLNHLLGLGYNFILADSLTASDQEGFDIIVEKDKEYKCIIELKATTDNKYLQNAFEKYKWKFNRKENKIEKSKNIEIPFFVMLPSNKKGFMDEKNINGEFFIYFDYEQIKFLFDFFLKMLKQDIEISDKNFFDLFQDLSLKDYLVYKKNKKKEIHFSMERIINSIKDLENIVKEKVEEYNNLEDDEKQNLLEQEKAMMKILSNNRDEEGKLRIKETISKLTDEKISLEKDEDTMYDKEVFVRYGVVYDKIRNYMWEKKIYTYEQYQKAYQNICELIERLKLMETLGKFSIITFKEDEGVLKNDGVIYINEKASDNYYIMNKIMYKSIFNSNNEQKLKKMFGEITGKSKFIESLNEYGGYLLLNRTDNVKEIKASMEEYSGYNNYISLTNTPLKFVLDKIEYVLNKLNINYETVHYDRNNIISRVEDRLMFWGTTFSWIGLIFAIFHLRKSDVKNREVHKRISEVKENMEETVKTAVGQENIPEGNIVDKIKEGRNTYKENRGEIKQEHIDNNEKAKQQSQNISETSTNSLKNVLNPMKLVNKISEYFARDTIMSQMNKKEIAFIKKENENNIAEKSDKVRYYSIGENARNLVHTKVGVIYVKDGKVVDENEEGAETVQVRLAVNKNNEYIFYSNTMNIKNIDNIDTVMEELMDKFRNEGVKTNLFNDNTIFAFPNTDKKVLTETDIENSINNKQTSYVMPAETIKYTFEDDEDINERICKGIKDKTGITTFVVSEQQYEKVKQLDAKGYSFIVKETDIDTAFENIEENQGSVFIDLSSQKYNKETAEEKLKQIRNKKLATKQGVNLAVTVKFRKDTYEEMVDINIFEEYGIIPIVEAKNKDIVEGKKEIDNITDIKELENKADIIGYIFNGKNIEVIEKAAEEVGGIKTIIENIRSSIKDNPQKQYNKGHAAALKNNGYQLDDSKDITSNVIDLKELLQMNSKDIEELLKWQGEESIIKIIKENLSLFNLQAQSYINEELLAKGKYIEAIGFILGVVENSVAEEVVKEFELGDGKKFIKEIGSNENQAILMTIIGQMIKEKNLEQIKQKENDYEEEVEMKYPNGVINLKDLVKIIKEEQNMNLDKILRTGIDSETAEDVKGIKAILTDRYGADTTVEKAEVAATLAIRTMLAAA